MAGLNALLNGGRNVARPNQRFYDSSSSTKEFQVKAEEVLPDNQNQVERNGVIIRKGSVGAFLSNAAIWGDPSADAARRATAERDIIDLLPALRALNLFDVLAIRDERLRRLVDSHEPNRAHSCETPA
jgi:hypothetical protein